MDRRLAFILIALLVVALLRYVVLALFVHPFADDFSYAVAGMRTELLPRLRDEYALWNGRWFSNILVLRGPLVLGIEQGLPLYRLVAVGLITFTGFGAFRLVRAVAPGMAPARAVLVAALFLLVYLQLMPDLSEGIYWYTGAVSYQFPGALTLLLMASWVRTFDRSAIPGARRVVWNAVLAMVISGCNELHMVLILVLHTALLLFRWRAGAGLDRRVLLVLLVSLAAATVMILAPGNAGRGGQFPHRHEPAHTLVWGALQTARFLATWIFSPTLLAVSLLYLTAVEQLRTKGPLLIPDLRPWMAILLLVGTTFLAMALPYWATGLLGQHRTVNATLLFVLPFWFLVLTSMRTYWMKGTWMRSPMSTPASMLVCTLLALVVLATGSGGRVSSDLVRGHAAAFDAALTDRYVRIQQARERKDGAIDLPRLEALTSSLRYLDGGPDPAAWINRSIAYYFQADTMDIRIGLPASGTTGPVQPR